MGQTPGGGGYPARSSWGGTLPGPAWGGTLLRGYPAQGIPCLGGTLWGYPAQGIPCQGGNQVGYPPRPGQDGGTLPGGYPTWVPPSPQQGTPRPEWGGYPVRTTGVLTTRRAVCLLRSRRRTFLFVLESNARKYYKFVINIFIEDRWMSINNIGGSVQMQLCLRGFAVVRNSSNPISFSEY